MADPKCYCDLVEKIKSENKGIYCPVHTPGKSMTNAWDYWNYIPSNYTESERLNKPYWVSPHKIRVPLFIAEVFGPEGNMMYGQIGSRKVARFGNPMSLEDYKSLYAHLDDETGEYYWMVAPDLDPSNLKLLGRFMAFRQTMKKRTFSYTTKTGPVAVDKTMYIVKQVRFPPPRPGLLEPGDNLLKLQALERIEVSHQVTLASLDRLLS